MEIELSEKEQRLLQELADKYADGSIALLISRMAKELKGTEHAKRLAKVQAQFAKIESGKGKQQEETTEIVREAMQAFYEKTEGEGIS